MAILKVAKFNKLTELRQRSAVPRSTPLCLNSQPLTPQAFVLIDGHPTSKLMNLRESPNS
ncbi:hypothetical protein OUZ56_001173 [Daphnia magna]|uniref:Uncharacterized protein n=1 Tax=Daphnia magna TaxID=35525 RepID=A0ABR0A1V1_9CRUS|nr:hypothetical protein OUZ56_001173 [Daphnia magna]